MKNKFKHYLRIILDEPLNKHDIKGLITVIKKNIANVFNPIEEGAIVIYRIKNAKHIYDFNFNRNVCLLYTSPSPRDRQKSRMPSSA